MPETIEVVPSIENGASLSSASSASATNALFHPADLDPSIIRAAELGFVIAPVLTHSRVASARSYIGAPTNDLEQIAEAAARYPQCNWTLHVGASGLVVLEIDTRIGYASLSTLCRNSFGRWTKTLQFQDSTSRFFLFRSMGCVRFLGQRFQGLRVHTGNAFMLIPPAHFVRSEGLAYVNPDAAIVDAPDFLSEMPPSSRKGEEIPTPLLAT